MVFHAEDQGRSHDVGKGGGVIPCVQKVRSILYCTSLYNNGQDFLDIQYSEINHDIWFFSYFHGATLYISYFMQLRMDRISGARPNIP